MPIQPPTGETGPNGPQPSTGNGPAGRTPAPRKRLLPWLILGLVVLPVVAGGIGYGIYQAGHRVADDVKLDVQTSTVHLNSRDGVQMNVTAAGMNRQAVAVNGGDTDDDETGDAPRADALMGQAMGDSMRAMAVANQTAMAATQAAVTAADQAATSATSHLDGDTVVQTSQGSNSMNIFSSNQNVSVVNGVVTINGVVQNGKNGAGTVGKGPVIDSVRTVSAFSKLDSSLSANLSVVRGASPSVTVKTEENVQQHIVTEVKGDTLVIKASGNFSSHHPIDIVITAPAPLRKVAISGTGHVDLGEQGGDLSIDLSGTAQITGRGSFGRVKADLSGVGSLDLSGTADSVNLDQSGVGQAHLGNLVANDVELDISGVGGASVNARNSVSGDLSGIGSLSVSGNPARRNVDRSGLGSVRYHG